jgi:ACR3 family arsenite efflux pump ArsB
VYSDKLAATGKYSKETLDEYDMFQHGMLIRTGILLGVVVLYMITLASLPNVAGTSFLIPLGVMALSLLVYAVVAFVGCWKLNRLFTADRKRRRQGLLG